MDFKQPREPVFRESVMKCQVPEGKNAFDGCAGGFGRGIESGSFREMSVKVTTG